MVLRYQIYFAILFLSLVFSWGTVGRKYGITATLLLAWVLISAGLDFQNPQEISEILDIKLRLVSCRSFALVTMLVYFMTTLETRLVPYLVRCFEMIVVINSLVYIIGGYGVFNAGSMDMAFNAMVYPLLVFRPMYAGTKTEIFWRGLVAGIPLICLFFNTPGSTVFISLAVGVGAFLVMRRAWPLVLVSTSALMIFGFLREFAFFSDSGRFEPWKLFMTSWWNSANILTGTGTGTFQWLGPLLQDKDTGLFLFMHNEYLQVAFEQGLIGVLLSGILLVICLRRALSSDWLLSSCLATMVVAFFQFPLRFSLSQVFVLLLIRLCLDDESRKLIENP